MLIWGFEAQIGPFGLKFCGSDPKSTRHLNHAERFILLPTFRLAVLLEFPPLDEFVNKFVPLAVGFWPFELLWV